MASAAKEAPQEWWQAALQWLTGAPLQIVLIIVVAFVAQFVLRWAIRHAVRQTSIRAQRERLENLRKIARTADLSQVLLTQRTEQRASAIGTLLSSVVSISVWAVAAMTILPLLGVDIAPLATQNSQVGLAARGAGWRAVTQKGNNDERGGNHNQQRRDDQHRHPRRGDEGAGLQEPGPRRRRLLEALHHELGERPRRVGAPLRDGLGHLVRVRRHHHLRALARERRVAGQHLVRHHAE